MSSGSAIRGSRVGSSPMRPTERSEPAPRREVTYWCASGHAIEIRLAADVEPPEVWDCPRCGLPASLDCDNPPAPPKTEPYKTHLAYVKERRSDKEAAEILDEAIATLRSRRKSGDIVF